MGRYPRREGLHASGLHDEIVTALQDIDGALCEPPYKLYQEVLVDVVQEFGRRFDFPVDRADRQVLISSVPSWQPFPDTVDVLQQLSKQYRLAIISNIDDDLFVATAQKLGVRFADVITAEQTRSYKPNPAIFEEALRRLAVEPHQVAHIAEGVTEVPTARLLGCTTVWVRRHGRSARLRTEAPDLEVPDLKSFLTYVTLDPTVHNVQAGRSRSRAPRRRGGAGDRRAGNQRTAALALKACPSSS